MGNETTTTDDNISAPRRRNRDGDAVEDGSSILRFRPKSIYEVLRQGEGTKGGGDDADGVGLATGNGGGDMEGVGIRDFAEGSGDGDGDEFGRDLQVGRGW